MLLGKVVGTLVSTKKDEKLVGNTIKIVQLIDANGNPINGFEVAVDTVGSKNGNYVIMVKSSSARMTKLTEDKPVDNAIVAIVDIIEENNKILYNSKED
jgi:microcompartment protein CcmK/EutM